MKHLSQPLLGNRKSYSLAKRTKRIVLGLVLTSSIFPHHNALADTSVNLGAAGNFAVLAGSTITTTGLSVIKGGDVGVSPGTAVTGFPPGIVVPPNTFHDGDAVAAQAQADLTSAYNNAAGRTPTTILSGQDLGGKTLAPGVYSFAAASQLTGILTLDDQGDPNAVFIFQVGSAFTTAADSAVVTINDGGSTTPGQNIIWQLGSAATLGADTAFEGNILASTSITVDSGASVSDGRLLALNGAVTLDDNVIAVLPDASGPSAVPDTGITLLMLAAGLMALATFRQQGQPIPALAHATSVMTKY